MRRDLQRDAAQAIRRDPGLPWVDRPIIHGYTRHARHTDELPVWLQRLLTRTSRGV